MTKLEQLENKIRRECNFNCELGVGSRVFVNVQGRGSEGIILQCTRDWGKYEDGGKLWKVFNFKTGEAYIEYSYDLTLIQPEITLDHVLKASNCNIESAYPQVDQTMCLSARDENRNFKYAYWQLGKPLNDQSQETIDFLHPIICTNE